MRYLYSTVLSPVCTWESSRTQPIYHIAFLVVLATTSTDFDSTGMHCLPATSLAANENHFRCFASSTSSDKNLYWMRKRVRKFLASVESRRRFSSAFLGNVDHGAWEKSYCGWTCRVRLTRRPSPSSPFTLHRSRSVVSMYSMSSINSPLRQGPDAASFIVLYY